MQGVSAKQVSDIKSVVAAVTRNDHDLFIMDLVVFVLTRCRVQ